MKTRKWSFLFNLNDREFQTVTTGTCHPRNPSTSRGFTLTFEFLGSLLHILSWAYQVATMCTSQQKYEMVKNNISCIFMYVYIPIEKSSLKQSKQAVLRKIQFVSKHRDNTVNVWIEILLFHWSCSIQMYMYLYVYMLHIANRWHDKMTPPHD